MHSIYLPCSNISWSAKKPVAVHVKYPERRRKRTSSFFSSINRTKTYAFHIWNLGIQQGIRNTHELLLRLSLVGNQLRWYNQLLRTYPRCLKMNKSQFVKWRKCGMSFYRWVHSNHRSFPSDINRRIRSAHWDCELFSHRYFYKWLCCKDPPLFNGKNNSIEWSNDRLGRASIFTVFLFAQCSLITARTMANTVD